MKLKDLLEDREFIPPGPDAQRQLEPFRARRYANLSDIRCDGKVCSWCNAKPIEKGRKKYCSEACVFSAQVYVNPQTPKAKAWVFVAIQSCACRICGEDFEDELVAIAESKRPFMTGLPRDGKFTLSYWGLGYGTGERWQVDHIVPIHKGGRGIGFENVQVVCATCHRKKTAVDLSKVKVVDPEGVEPSS